MAIIRTEQANGYKLTNTRGLMLAEVSIYDAPKFKGANGLTTTHYGNVKYVEVIKNAELNAELELNGMEADPYSEYVIIHTTDGTATYRNSYCDLFIW